MRILPAQGSELVKSCEACALKLEGGKLTAYDDARPNYILKPDDKVLGTLTIGWGHAGTDIKIGTVWTQEQADEALERDLAVAQQTVEGNVKVPLNDDQYSALVDFVFNVGSKQFNQSSLLALLNKGNYESVPGQLARFVYSNKKKIGGLVSRRAKEIALWNTPDISQPSVNATIIPDTIKKPSPARSLTFIGAAVAGCASTISNYAPDIAQSLSDTATQLQPLVEYGHAIKVTFLALSLSGAAVAMVSRLHKMKKEGT